jgi:hypothetical protein
VRVVPSENRGLKSPKVQECPSTGAATGRVCGLPRPKPSIPRSLPLVRREGRQDFILLTRRDPEMIERASQLRCDFIELLGVMCRSRRASSSPRGVLPGFVAANVKGPATLQTHRVRMNFNPGSLSSWSVCHSRSSGFFDAWPTMG